MADLALIFGTDLQTSNSGDLALFDGGDYAIQRVLRRLLTNPGDYYWQPAYGAGLAAFIGQPTNVATIQAISRLQMRLEPVVSQSPEPTITITATSDGAVYETIQFVSAQTGESMMSPKVNLTAVATGGGTPSGGTPGSGAGGGGAGGGTTPKFAPLGNFVIGSNVLGTPGG